MLSKTKEICGVFHLFKIDGEIIFYLSEKGGIVSYLIENESIIWNFQGTKYYSILIYEQLIFLDDANGLIKVLNKEKGSLQNEFQNFGISCEMIIDNSILLYSGLNTISFDYDKLLVKWNLPIRLLPFDIIYGYHHIYARKYLTESVILALDSKTGICANR